jgi:perosamine synthetase
MMVSHPVGDATAPHSIIPVYRPDLSGNERRYVMDCVDTSWISSIGGFIPRFERALADVTGARHAIAVCNGTVALHLALHCLGLGPGDEVIVPTFTYIASVNTIAQTGATPVFADVRRSNWLLDPDDVEQRITAQTRAILPVHLYGAVCDMSALYRIADDRGLRIIEDCAESLGATLNGRHTGLFGDIGTFSFFGNKTITTGEGGAVITQDDALAMRLRQVKGQGQSFTRRYWHEVLGFNYRMTNIAAAIGVAQFERFEDIRARKRAIAQQYRVRLAELPVVFQRSTPDVDSSDWLITVLLPEGADRDRIMTDMQTAGIETRPVFYCAHTMPMYATGDKLPVAEAIAARGISLPSFPSLTDGEVNRVADALGAALATQHLL